MIEETINSIVAKALSLPLDSKLAESISFFIYDSVKIIILMFIMIFIVGYLRSYISKETIKKLLSGQKLGIGNFFASLFGAITPFCSCSSIPFFMGFIKSGVPLGVAFSFLITSPLVNEYLVVIMMVSFGWKVTLAYVLAGMLIGIIAGAVIGKLKMEKYIEKDYQAMYIAKEKKFTSQRQRLFFGFSEAKNIIKSIWIWVLVGVGLGAVLHGYVPSALLQGFISKSGAFGVIIATVIGIPLYANCAAIVPIALVLFQKGIPLGTALAFMMATAALSLPEAVILRKIMKLRLIAAFFTVVAIGIILLGYLFNFLQSYLF